MQITGAGTETFLFLNGIRVERRISLGGGIEILPAECKPTPEFIMAAAKSEADIGVMALFLRDVSAQLRVTAPDSESLAVAAWNGVWDGLLLSAMFDCQAVCNFQSNRPAEEVHLAEQLSVTNCHFRGHGKRPAPVIEGDQCEWVEAAFPKARDLLAVDEFQVAAHSMASYRWNPHPRVQLAILWSGIESLFKIESELVFRLSFYCARFLEPSDSDRRTAIFKRVKQLYKQRSAAVHGSSMKKSGDPVRQSADLLKTLLRQCVAVGAIPDVEALAP